MVSMAFTTFDRFLSLPIIPDTFSRLTQCRPIPRYAQSSIARRSSFVRVDIAAKTSDFGKFKQIKLTIQSPTARRGVITV